VNPEEIFIKYVGVSQRISSWGGRMFYYGKLHVKRYLLQSKTRWFFSEAIPVEGAVSYCHCNTYRASTPFLSKPAFVCQIYTRSIHPKRYNARFPATYLAAIPVEEVPARAAFAQRAKGYPPD
jgi:hypothetical protein